ncbi:response regulator [Tardiphaga sp.]|uniref:response regulator n=1 Tax=Tardiphaga sp. TaxID=1926292 RepID=UPI0025D79FF7|nr:response regulator [Tardiphaga sp.]
MTGGWDNDSFFGHHALASKDLWKIGSDRKIVLVIDDDDAVLSTIDIILSRRDIVVIMASNGEEAIEKLTLATFDLVIVDLFMPRMDGLETIMALHRLAPETPVLAVSGSADWAGAPLPDLLTAAIAFGATSCLKKPFRPDELVAAVGRLMAIAR